MDYNTIKLLNFEGLDIDFSKSSIEKKHNILFCTIVLNKSTLKCPYCFSENTISHGFYTKTISHSILNSMPCIIKYKARRYICKTCLSTFFEKNPFCQKDLKVSLYTELTVLEKLKDHTSTFTSVAKNSNLSVQTIINIFDKHVTASPLPLNEIICIDEIYTKKLTNRKYCCIIYDFLKNKIIDIYPSRLKTDLLNYFLRIPLNSRKQVKYVVMDMWDTYKDVCKGVFPYSEIAVDSFHVISHLNKAIDDVRLRVMRKFNKENKSINQADMYYYMLKKFHYFFTKSFDKIYDGDIPIHKIRSKWNKFEIRKYLLSIDDELKKAYLLKSEYQEFNLHCNYEDCQLELDEFIIKFKRSGIAELEVFGKLISNWKNEIINSFIRINGKRLSNAKLEGCNSKLKCIIKNANGYGNFKRFRTKCIYSINKDVPIK